MPQNKAVTQALARFIEELLDTRSTRHFGITIKNDEVIGTDCKVSVAVAPGFFNFDKVEWIQAAREATGINFVPEEYGITALSERECARLNSSSQTL